MNDEKEFDLFLEIKSQLTSLNTNMTNVLQQLTKHEQRICNLETNRASFKDKVVEYLIKALIATIAIIGSLTGAGQLLKTIFSPS